jgi:hypothetical protein
MLCSRHQKRERVGDGLRRSVEIRRLESRSGANPMKRASGSSYGFTMVSKYSAKERRGLAIVDKGRSGIECLILSNRLLLIRDPRQVRSKPRGAAVRKGLVLQIFIDILASRWGVACSCSR